METFRVSFARFSPFNVESASFAIVVAVYYLSAHNEFSPDADNFAFFSWRPLPEMQEARKDFGIAWHSDGRSLFAVGGKSESKTTSTTVEMFTYDGDWDTEEPITGRWKYVASIQSASQSYAVAFIGGKLIAIGGVDVQVFTPPTDPNSEGQWTSVVKLSEPLQMLALIPIDNCLVGLCRFIYCSMHFICKLV